jgi:hypothetical protein
VHLKKPVKLKGTKHIAELATKQQKTYSSSIAEKNQWSFIHSNSLSCIFKFAVKA